MMSPAGGRHGVCCTKVAYCLHGFVEPRQLGFVASNDTGFVMERGPDTVRAPDVGFWSIERLPVLPITFVDIAPDLAVEVMSPGNTSAAMQRRAENFLSKGARLVWVLDPENREVTVYGPGRQPLLVAENETLSGEDVLKGFNCRVTDLLPPEVHG